MAMTMTSTGTGSAPDTISPDLIRTARTTGLLYLAFFITGISGSMLVRGQLFAADDAQGTLSAGRPVRSRLRSERPHEGHGSST